MSEKHTVAMFVQGEDGRRVQVGWASPKNSSGVRTFEYSPGYEESRPKNVSFEDDELTQQVAEEQFEAQKPDGTDGEEFKIEVLTDDNLNLVTNDEPQEVVPAAPIQDIPDPELAADPIDAAPDAELADDPTDDAVELSSGGEIVEVADEDEDEAEFQRLLAEEEAEAAKAEHPATRRELRDNEG